MHVLRKPSVYMHGFERETARFSEQSLVGNIGAFRDNLNGESTNMSNT